MLKIGKVRYDNVASQSFSFGEITTLKLSAKTKRMVFDSLSVVISPKLNDVPNTIPTISRLSN